MGKKGQMRHPDLIYQRDNMEKQEFTKQEIRFLQEYTHGAQGSDELYAKRVYKRKAGNVTEETKYIESTVYALYYSRSEAGEARHYFSFIVGYAKNDGQKTLELFGTEDFFENYRECMEATEDWIGEKYVERPQLSMLGQALGQDTMEKKIDSIHRAYQRYAWEARKRVEEVWPLTTAAEQLLKAVREADEEMKNSILDKVEELNRILKEKEAEAKEKRSESLKPLFTTEEEMSQFIEGMTKIEWM